MPAPPGCTPCPIPGIDDDQHAHAWWHTVTRLLPEQVGGLSKTPTRKSSGFLIVYPPEGGPGEEKVEGSLPPSATGPLSLRLRPSLTLQAVYEQVGKHYKLTGNGWAVCHRASGAVLGAEDLSGGGADVVAVVDRRKTIEEGVLGRALPLPRGPVPKPVVKNADDLFMPSILVSHLKLMKEWGPVCSLSLPGKEWGDGAVVFVADPDLLEQIVSTPEVWQKLHMKHSKLIRGFVGDGIFTSDDDEEIWGVAHRILLPAFSNHGMRNYFNDVMHCTDLLFHEWDRLVYGNGLPLDMTPWAEHFTLDVIGRVAFATDFQATTTGKHPYLDRLASSAEAMETLRGYSFFGKAVFGASLAKKFLEANQGNVAMVDDMVRQRKEELSRGEGVDRKDMLTLMLTAKDPKTGLQLPDDNIRNQILTFLFAGHDSTSTALTLLMLNIAQHGHVEQKLLEEIDRVVGEGPLTYEKLGKLEYTTQVINESLRLFPPAQAVRKQCVSDTRLGPYHVPKGTGAVLGLWALAHNPDVWPDPWKFDPDRWAPEASAARSPYASMPFSFGPRGCLGRQLSIMEQRVFVVRVLQRYHVRLHARATPQLSAPLFLKPHGILLTLQHRNRPSPLPSPLPPSALPKDGPPPTITPAPKSLDASLPVGSSLLVLYGSNMGTGEAFAQELGNQASSLGLPSTVLPLDDILTQTSLIKQSSAVLVVCSTYNGTPPDNASAFVKLLSDSPAEASVLFSGVRYSVFGCGNSQWARTYQRVPTLIDQALQQAGGVRLCEFGGGDADGMLEESLEEWKKAAWQAILTQLGVDASAVRGSVPSAAGLLPVYRLRRATWDPTIHSIEQVASDFAKHNGLFHATLTTNTELQDVSVSGRSTRHIELSLPKGTHYTAGDHLAVYGGNPPQVVSLAASLVGVALDDVVSVELDHPQRTASNIIPLQVPLRVRMILTWCVELQQPATKQQVSHLLSVCACPPEKKALEAMLEDYEASVLKPRRTVLELLQAHKSIQLDLSLLLSLLGVLKPRYYSISSSPKASPSSVSITVGVVQGTSPTGREHLGLASSYLSRSPVGSHVRVFIKDTKSAFRLPDDPNTPIILVGPGTGVAPLRGFLLDREASGAKGSAVLFFGCRGDADYIYKDEMQRLLDKKVLQGLHVAFSRKPGVPKTYVQDLIRAEGASLAQLLEHGGHVYVCGDAKHMAPDVREAFASLLSLSRGNDVEQGRAQLEQMIRDNRYHEDVWASA